jgi:branched-chain amino acid transport system substrate-binding protein
MLALAAGSAAAQDKEIVIGLQCDRTGATQIVGTTICPAYHDYVGLVNSKGGVEGYKIKVLEIEHEYKVPPAMEAHERFKKEGAVIDGVYGTPQIAALNKKLEEDKILGTSPGFGTAAAADGKKYPYTFPIAASYWSQGAGKEPIAVVEDLAATEGFELRTFAVPSPGIEMAAQVLDITTALGLAIPSAMLANND